MMQKKLFIICALLLLQCVSALAAPPSVPTIGPAAAERGGRASIVFTPPSSDGGSQILDYTVTASPGGMTSTGSSSPIFIGGLSYGTRYTFTVTARNSDGSSLASGSSNPVMSRPYAPVSGIINNLVVFIRFSDQPEFSRALSYYDGQFNTASNSLKNFYLENSYTTLTVSSSFYPVSSDGAVLSYMDSHPTGYYLPYNANTNTVGYIDGTDAENRETALIQNALDAIKDQIPVDLILDSDNDGYVDHIAFEVFSSTANPVPVKFYSRAAFDASGTVMLKGKKVGSYTWISAWQDQEPMYPGATEIHEMGHSFGYPDLRQNTGRMPVGNRDVMSLSKPTGSGAYEKYRFTGWITDIPEIKAYGDYTINDLTQATNNSYKIKLSNGEFLILEYRKRTGTSPFEALLPDSGLCITRVNEQAGVWGNMGGPPFFLYYFRPDGTAVNDGSNPDFFCLNEESGRVQFNDYSNPACFLSDGTPCGISIYNIGPSSGSSISFKVGDPAATVLTHVVSGTINYGNTTNRVQGVTVDLSGDSVATTTTDNLGNYHFTANAGGNYTVTPTKANVLFSPTSRAVTNLTSDQVLNFSATKITNRIYGTLTNSTGMPLSGIPVYINCPAGGNYVGNMPTDVTGNYSFIVDAGSTCDLYPNLTNYTFVPHTKTFTNVTTDQIQNFTTHPSNLTLSGKITLNGVNVSGVSVNCPGASTKTPVTTDGAGAYSFTVSVGDGVVYTVTPSSLLYLFSPTSRSYPGLYANQVNQDFSAVLLPLLTVNISGSGSVSSSPSGINCPVGACSAYFAPGVSVELAAVGTTGFDFSSWSDACLGSTSCTVSMDADKSVAATFIVQDNVRINGISYGTLTSAYAAVAATGGTIMSRDQTFTEDLQLNGPGTVKLLGGCDSSFVSNKCSGYTTVFGTVTLGGSGGLTFDRIVVK